MIRPFRFLSYLAALFLCAFLLTGGSTTAISWATSTVNFWMGCRKKSQGCKFCYAERMYKRDGRDFNAITRTSRAYWLEPLKWSSRVIFTCSLSDFFIEEADQWRPEAWDIIRQASQHDWLILTKRPERIAECLPPDWGEGWDHVWIGVSVEDQHNADERLPILVSIPAKHKFISAEPLIAPINIEQYLGAASPQIEWVITGGESGNPGEKIRTLEPAWVIDVHGQAQRVGAIHHHKQNGGTMKIAGEWGGFLVEGHPFRDLPDFPSLKAPPAQMSMF